MTAAPRGVGDVFLFGATSMNGWSVVRKHGAALTPFCNPYARSVACKGWPRLRLEDEAAIGALFRDTQPRVLIHCGGICHVGKCQEHPAFAEQLNVRSVELLLRHLPPATRLVYCSSDHVFGVGGGCHDEAAVTAPVSVYGETRVAAERLIRDDRPDALIIRAGLGVGPSIAGRTGHLDWLRYRHARNLTMTVVADEIRSAVWAGDLADRIWHLAMSERTGIQHVVATHSVDRPRLARYLCERFDIDAEVLVERRADRTLPHLGDVTLATRHAGPLAAPLAAVTAGW